MFLAGRADIGGVKDVYREKRKGNDSEKDASYHDDTTDEDQSDEQIAWL